VKKDGVTLGNKGFERKNGGVRLDTTYSLGGGNV